MLFIKTLLIISTFFQPKPLDFSDFSRFVQKTQRLPASIKDSCTWNYAVIKIKINSENKISSYTSLLNRSKPDLVKSLEFLKGYNFGKVELRNRSLVFIYTVEVQNYDCVGQRYNETPDDVLGTVLSTLDQERKKHPETMYLYDPITTIVYATAH